MIGCCGASINVDESIVTESVFVDTNNYYNFPADSFFHNTVIRLLRQIRFRLKIVLSLRVKKKLMLFLNQWGCLKRYRQHKSRLC